MPAYELSRFYCAALLNRACGPLQVVTFVEPNDDGVLISLDDLAAATLLLLCDPCAANTGPGGDPDCIAAIQGCINEWSDISSEGTKVYIISREPADFMFESPY